MKKLIILITALVAFSAVSQAQELPKNEWNGLYIGSDTLLKPNGDSLLLFGYVLKSEVRYADTASRYQYRLHKVVISPTDTNYSRFDFYEYYGKNDSLYVSGQWRSGRWLLNYHYNSTWREDDKTISRKLFQRKREVIGW